MAIQLFVPTFDVDGCLNEIRDCLEKGWTGLGYKTLEFEEAWKKYNDLPYAHYLNSATVGLNLVFEMFKEYYDWSENDEVITTPLTFVSTNHSILIAGLKPIFADVDNTLCIDPISVESLITEKTRAVLFVGIGGNTGKFEEIVKICKKHNLKIILDAAHMSGTRLNGQSPAKLADVSVFSFQAVKNLPTADSGMICFKEGIFDEIVRKKTWLGINKDTYARFSEGGNYKWKYDVEYVGYKYHGNSIMAAIGLVQLKHLDIDNSYRRQICGWYTEAFSKYKEEIQLVEVPNNCEPARHLYQIIVKDRDGLLTHLNKKDIFPGVHYIDNTEYRMYAYAKGTCPNSNYVSDHVLSLPLHLRLTYEDVQTIINAVIEYVTAI